MEDKDVVGTDAGYDPEGAAGEGGEGALTEEDVHDEEHKGKGENYLHHGEERETSRAEVDTHVRENEEDSDKKKQHVVYQPALDLLIADRPPTTREVRVHADMRVAGYAIKHVRQP